jgi:hypothetical protein
MNRPVDPSFAENIFFGGPLKIKPEVLDQIKVIGTYRGGRPFSETEGMSCKFNFESEKRSIPLIIKM